jgi:hypothetical protein
MVFGFFAGEGLFFEGRWCKLRAVTLPGKVFRKSEAVEMYPSG